MTAWRPDGRVFRPTMEALVRREREHVVLLCPAVGAWRGVPCPGTVLVPGSDLGELEILGVHHRLLVPANAGGVVLDEPAHPGSIPIPIAYGDVLVRLDPRATVGATGNPTRSSATVERGLVFLSPLSGRYYARPAPDKPPFVQVGDEIQAGQTVALLEVMKTFNRIVYGGPGLPERARIKAVIPTDEDDLSSGDPILELEPV